MLTFRFILWNVVKPQTVGIGTHLKSLDESDTRKFLASVENASHCAKVFLRCRLHDIIPTSTNS